MTVMLARRITPGGRGQRGGVGGSAVRFVDRADAGRRLAAELRDRITGDVVVVGLPRGGVPVAAEVAETLRAPLDVLCVRKLGMPGSPEFAIGAIAEGDVHVLDRGLVARVGVSERALQQVVVAEARELERQAAKFRAGRAPVSLDGRTVVIVDDGLATGATAHAAARAARRQGARRIVLAVPVAAPASARPDQLEVDEIVAVATPRDFRAVGEWYQQFLPTTDDEVLEALDRVGNTRRAPTEGVGAVGGSSVVIPAGTVSLAGRLAVPSDPRGVVVFVHGSGSSRLSPRNVAVAAALNERGFATLLFDLLTEHEASDRRQVFDTRQLAERLSLALRWLATRSEVLGAPVGLFGASTGAAAALRVAASGTAAVATVVSRGGRPDLAEDVLGRVSCPVLLIVGGADRPTLAANEWAADRLRAPHRLEVVSDTGHLFEEPGALDEVVRLAGRWFDQFLAGADEDRTTPKGTGKAAR